MFVYFLLLLNVLMLFFTFGSFSEKKRIIVPLAEAISVFLCLYIITSAFMWMFNIFSIEFCLLAVTLWASIAFVIRYFKSDEKGLDFFKIGTIRLDYRVFLNRLAIFVAVFLSIGAYSTFGIGYNDGNAQAQAVSILNGNNSKVFEVEEYDNFKQNSQYRVYFFDSIKNIDNENFTANYRISEVDTSEGKIIKMQGEFGSNPVYPSILALSADVFGIKRMTFIQAVFAFCLLVFVDEILKALKCNWKLRSILILLLGVSPILVYSNHTALVEPVIGFCMIVFAYYLLCKERKSQILSVLGVISFSFLHSSAFTMIPLFLIIYWMYYIHSQKIRHLISSAIIVLGYVLSFIYLNIVARENTSINYRIGMPFLKDYYFLYVILIALIAIVAFLVLLILFPAKKAEKIEIFEKTKGKTIFKIGIMAVNIAFIAFVISASIVKCNSFKDIFNVTFIAFVVCSGVVLLPFIVGRLIIGEFPIGIKEASIIISFEYTIILYSSVMKFMVEGFYYDARYLASFLPFIILIGGMLLGCLKKEEKYILPIIGIIILFTPYTTSLLSSDAEKRLDENIYEGVIETIEDYSDENTFVLVDQNMMKYFYYPLLGKNNVSVYPFDYSLVDTFCFDTKEKPSSVLYITDSIDDEVAEHGKTCFMRENRTNECKEEDISLITGLPNAFHEKYKGDVKVVKFDSLYKLVDYSKVEEIDISALNISVTDVEVDKKENACITISFSEETKMYHNENGYALSYHVISEDYEVYDNPRKELGELIVGDYTLDYNLSEIKNTATIIVDVIEEGVQWYSYHGKVPAVTFIKNGDEWNYSVEMIDLR